MLAQNSTLKTTPAIPAASGVVNRWRSAGELDLATGHTFSTTFAVTKGRRFARQPVLETVIRDEFATPGTPAVVTARVVRRL